MLSLLKAKGWASALHASSSRFRAWDMFEVEVRDCTNVDVLEPAHQLQIRLTNTGLDALNDVIRIVYQYINLLCNENRVTDTDWQRVFDEVSRVS